MSDPWRHVFDRISDCYLANGSKVRFCNSEGSVIKKQYGHLTSITPDKFKGLEISDR